MKIADFRTQYPQYDHVGDVDLATALHTKFYSHAPQEEFFKRFGVDITDREIGA